MAIANTLQLEAARRRAVVFGLFFSQICIAHEHKLLFSDLWSKF